VSLLADFDTGLVPSELDPARPRLIDTPWGAMALYPLGGEIRCWQAFCPHLEGPLFQGTLSSFGGARYAVTCPWHRWCFDLSSGERLDGPDSAARGAALVGCEVAQSARGTILLRRPGTRPG
jgi:nitrite reductase/ring-hydroxylating ferredoxin subunit